MGEIEINRFEKTLIDQDLRFTYKSLMSNRFFKGLFALGTYYSKENFPEEYKNDHLTIQIINFKSHIIGENSLENNNDICEDFCNLNQIYK